VKPDLAVRFLGHAAFLLRSSGGTTALIDPYDNEEGADPWFVHPMPQTQSDLLAMTHGHFDHSAEHRTVAVETLREPGEIARGEIRIRGFGDRHARIDYDNMIVVIEAGATRFCHIGDNRADIPAEIIDAIGAVDMLAVHVDDTRYFLEFQDVDRVIEAFRPGVVVPIHYRQPGISAETTEVGPCDEWLTTRGRVKHMSGEVSLDRKAFPDETEIWVLEPMPGPSTGAASTEKPTEEPTEESTEEPTQEDDA
jgi:L-ascorbate metabolism protein UlaG (beta-lactamase superfamily)